MKPAAWWKDAKSRFEELMTKGGHDLEVWGVDLHGGSPEVRHLFTALATGAGRAAGTGPDSGYETWLTVLRKKLQPLREDYFSVYHLMSTRRVPRMIHLSRIDLPATRRESRRDETSSPGIAPAMLIEAVEKTGMHMVVFRNGPRFVVHPEHLVTYAAYDALHRARVPCVVYDLKSSAKSKSSARSPRTVTRETSGEVVHHVCEASVRLCELFEVEAFAEEQAAPRIDGMPNTARREARKLDTEARYRRWQTAYRRLKRRRPNMSDVWYAWKIAGQEVAAGFKADTIRKHMKA